MTQTSTAGRTVDRLKVVEMNGRCYLMVEDGAFAIATTAKFDVVTNPEIIRAEAQTLVHRWNCHADLVRALEAAYLYKADMDPKTRALVEAALAATKTGGA